MGNLSQPVAAAVVEGEVKEIVTQVVTESETTTEPDTAAAVTSDEKNEEE